LDPEADSEADSETDFETDYETEVEADYEAAVPEAAPEASRRSLDRRQGTLETEDEPVPGPSPEVFARAVRDLLSAAGAPVSGDRESMLAAHQRLRGEIASATSRANAAERRRDATLAAAESASNAFVCPITHAVMVDPVVATDGHTYERAAVERWFADGRATSPVTNARLRSLTLVPNHALKSARAAWEDGVLLRATRDGGRDETNEIRDL
jgi:hypothetical protein